MVERPKGCGYIGMGYEFGYFDNHYASSPLELEDPDYWFFPEEELVVAKLGIKPTAYWSSYVVCGELYGERKELSICHNCLRKKGFIW